MKLNLGKAPHVEPKPEPRVFLEETVFTDHRNYSVEVKEDGVTVYSECCADTMSRETAIKTRDAITAWLEATQ